MPVAGQHISRLSVPVAGLVVFPLQTNHTRVSNGIKPRPPLWGDLSSIVLLHFKLPCSRMSKQTEPNGRCPPCFSEQRLQSRCESTPSVKIWWCSFVLQASQLWGICSWGNFRWSLLQFFSHIKALLTKYRMHKLKNTWSWGWELNLERRKHQGVKHQFHAAFSCPKRLMTSWPVLWQCSLWSIAWQRLWCFWIKTSVLNGYSLEGIPSSVN